MKKTPSNKIGYICVILTAIMWSFGGLMVKLIPWNALSINFARCLLALILRIVLKKSIKRPFKISHFIAAFCFFATTLLSVLATKHTSAGNASVLQYTSPLFLLLFAFIHKHKKPLLRDAMVSLVVIIGVAICCFSSLQTGGLLGNCFALLSGFCFSLLLYINSLPQSCPDNAMTIGFVLSLIVCLPAFTQETEFSLPIFFYVLVLGIFSAGISYILLEYGAKKISTLGAVLITGIEPILTPLWVAIFYGEPLSSFTILGGVLIVCACVYKGARDAARVKQ